MGIWDLVTGSIWLWWLTGTVLWAFIGVLLSSSLGLPLWLGILVGGLTWFVGVSILLIVGYARKQRVAAPPAPDFGGGDGASASAFGSSPGFGGSPGGFGGGFQPGSGFGGQSGFTTAPAGGGFGSSSGFSTPPGNFGGSSMFGGDNFAAGGFSGDDSFGSTGSFGPGPGAGGISTLGAVRGSRRFAAVQLTLLVTAVLAGGLMVLSAFWTWVDATVAKTGSDPLIDQSWGPKDFIPISFILVVSGALVAIFAALAHSRAQCRYLILAAVFIAPWFTVAVEFLLATTTAGQFGTIADYLSDGHFGAAVDTQWGLWFAFAGTALAVVWALTAAGFLLAARHLQPRQPTFGR